MKLIQLQVCVKPLISYDSKLGLYKTINDAYMLLKTDRGDFSLSLEKGIKWNGASIPLLFRWFLPVYDNYNDLYNYGSLIHDCLYVFKGGSYFSREEVDDIYRGILRQSGISRFKAGVVDKSVEWFAGGKSHWGSDENHIKSKIFLQAL